MKIKHISISREGCWLECQQKYKFRYHLEVPSPEPTPVYFTFGKIVHKIIETYTLARGSRPIDEISRAVMSGEIELEPGSQPPQLDVEYRNKLVRHLKNFLRLTDKVGLEGDVEWKFTMDLDGQGRCVTGFIDRMIRKGDNFFLLDYKTTKPSMWRKDSRTITKDLQLMCYCYVVMKEFGVQARDIQAALVFLDDHKIVPVRFSEQTLLSVPDRLLKTFLEIENTDPERVWGNVGRHCARCDYRKQCPFYSLT